MKKIKEIFADIQGILTIVAEDLIALAFSPVWYMLDMVERSYLICRVDIDDGDEEPQPLEEHHIKGFSNR